MLLPNHDRWLTPLLGNTWAEGIRASVRLPSLQVSEMVAEWLSTTVPFPE